MSHHKYSTTACVIDLKPRGETDAVVTLVTEELGVVNAYAKGLRSAKSKLRMILHECNTITVSLVKGRDVWRLTSAVGIVSRYEDLKKNKDAKLIAWKIHYLLVRLSPPGELHRELFQIVVGMWDGLTRIDKSYHKALECIVILNIISVLGYLRQVESLEEFIGEFKPSEQVLSRMNDLIPEAVGAINESIQATHL